ncbi:MAG: hypothetical protein AAF616_12355 [Bacteroidota bacterium]
MSNDRLYREFQNLERKIQLLVSENKNLRSNLEQRQNENLILKTKIESQQAHLSSFQDQVKMNRLGNTIVEKEDSAELKAQIDSYIKEIDKCIAYLAE